MIRQLWEWTAEAAVLCILSVLTVYGSLLAFHFIITAGNP